MAANGWRSTHRAQLTRCLTWPCLQTLCMPFKGRYEYASNDMNTQPAYSLTLSVFIVPNLVRFRVLSHSAPLSDGCSTSVFPDLMSVSCLSRSAPVSIDPQRMFESQCADPFGNNKNCTRTALELNACMLVLRSWSGPTHSPLSSTPASQYSVLGHDPRRCGRGGGMSGEPWVTGTERRSASPEPSRHSGESTSCR